MYGEENIISAVIHVDETTPHLHCDLHVDRRGNLYRRKTIGDKKKMRRTQEKSLKQCKSGRLALNLHV